jgi:hypothetical protein
VTAVAALPRDVATGAGVRQWRALFTANGVYAPEWLPRGQDAAFELHGSLAALQPHKADLLLIQGVDMKEHGSVNARPGGGSLLTNWRYPFPSEAGQVTSIDQQFALRGDGKPRFDHPSFMVGRGINSQDGISYRNGQHLVPEGNVNVAFERVFGGVAPKTAPGGAPDEALRQRAASRKSVLDYITRELGAVKPKLGSADRQKVDAHLDSVRGIENVLSAPAGTAGCTPPARLDPKTDPLAAANMPEVSRAYLDLITAALACDLTRSANLRWHRIASTLRYSWLGGPQAQYGHHDLSHGVGGSKAQVAPIDKFHGEQFAYLFGKLKAHSEGGGPLLDNTLVLCTSEFGTWTGGQHEFRNLPLILAGGRWAWKTGRFVRFSSEPLGRFLTSVSHALGLMVPNVGTAQYGAGPLAGLAG